MNFYTSSHSEEGDIAVFSGLPFFLACFSNLFLCRGFNHALTVSSPRLCIVRCQANPAAAVYRRTGQVGFVSAHFHSISLPAGIRKAVVLSASDKCRESHLLLVQHMTFLF
jgi:hypothetical protein